MLLHITHIHQFDSYAGNFTNVEVPLPDALGGVPSWTIPIDGISAQVGNSKAGASFKTGVVPSGFASIDAFCT
jgi:hypothetical protein